MWPIAKIEDIFEVARGGSPRPIQEFITDDPDGVNWIMIGDAKEDSKYIEVIGKKIKRSGVKSSRMVYPGDFLLTNSMSFGRPYILKTTGCIHDGWLVLSPKAKNIDTDYAYYCLGSGEIKAKLASKAAGAVVKNLNKDIVKDIEIPLPPLATQQHIARVLEQADQLRKQAQQMERELNQLAQSLFLEMFGDPVTNNRHLPKQKLGEIIKLKSGDFLPATDMRHGDIPVYGGNGISGYHDTFLFEEPKIVVGRVGAYCGAVHRTVAPCWITDNALYVESVAAEINATYLEHALRKANLNQYASQSGQPLVSGSRIYPVEILIPSLTEQEKFEGAVKKVEMQKKQAKKWFMK